MRIAVAQTAGSRLDEWPKTLDAAESMVQRAAGRNADLVVLPECLWPAYFLGSVDEYFAARAAGMPSDQWFLGQLADWARTRRIAICAGYVAEQGRRLYNAAGLIDEDGQLLGTYRKCFLWDFDHAFFEPGEAIVPISTRWGLVGLMICADARMPEIAATLAARGARLLLHPTAWVNVGTPDNLWNPQPDFLVPERAREFGVPTASASKCGVEGDTTFVGSSLVCNQAGNVVAQCSPREAEFIVVDVDLGSPRKPELTAAQRERLLGPQPPTMPVAHVPALRVVGVAEHAQAKAVALELAEGGASQAPLPTLLVLAPAPGRRSPAPGAQRGDNWLLLDGPSEQVEALGSVRVAAVRDHDTVAFGPVRALAFEGVHVVVVFGENTPERTLRCRAAENRIFVVQVMSSELVAYDPRGGRIAAVPLHPPKGLDSGTASAALELATAEAANKEFAPRTNPFTRRRPGLYEF